MEEENKELPNKHFIINCYDYEHTEKNLILVEKHQVVVSDAEKFDEILSLWKPHLKDFQSFFDFNGITYKTSPNIEFKIKNSFTHPFLCFIKQFISLKNNLTHQLLI